MIQMTYEQLTNRAFQGSVQKLAQMQLRTAEQFQVKHLIKGLQKNLDEMSDRFQKEILAKYAKGGDKAKQGNATGKSLELNLPFDALEGKEAEAKDAIKAFGERSFSVPGKKLSQDLLISLGAWTAGELIALEPIAADLVEAGSEAPGA